MDKLGTKKSSIDVPTINFPSSINESRNPSQRSGEDGKRISTKGGDNAMKAPLSLILPNAVDAFKLGLSEPRSSRQRNNVVSAMRMTEPTRKINAPVPSIDTLDGDLYERLSFIGSLGPTENETDPPSHNPVQSLHRVQFHRRTTWDKFKSFLGRGMVKLGCKKSRPVTLGTEFMSRYESKADYDVDIVKYEWSKANTWPFWRDFVIEQQNNVLVAWKTIVVCGLLYNVTIPWMVTFFMEQYTPWYIYTMDRVFDAVFIFDMLVKSRTTYRVSGMLVRSPRELLAKYASSFTFILDLLASLPFDLMPIADKRYYYKNHAYLRLNRSLKFAAFFILFRRLEMTSISSNLLGIVRLVIMMIIGVHWNACIFYEISVITGVGSDTWVYPGMLNIPIHNHSSADWPETFMYCFYRSLVLLTTIGDELTPQNSLEIGYVIINSLVGVLIFATIFGQVGNMVKNMNSERNMFQFRRDRVQKYMTLRAVSDGLVSKVMHWFEHMWGTSGVTDPGDIVSFLPEILRTEIAINVNLDSLSKVELFKDCERGFLIELVLKLRITQFSPGDYVCRHGDLGTSMYIVKTGQLHVLSPEGNLWAVLGEGQVFGEVSVINVDLSGAGRRRTANVISMGYSDLFCIQKDDLWETLALYPLAKQMLMDYGRARLHGEKPMEYNRRQHQLEETKSMPMDSKLDHLIDDLAVVGLKIDVLHKEMGMVIRSLQSLSLPRGSELDSKDFPLWPSTSVMSTCPVRRDTLTTPQSDHMQSHPQFPIRRISTGLHTSTSSYPSKVPLTVKQSPTPPVRKSSHVLPADQNRSQSHVTSPDPTTQMLAGPMRSPDSKTEDYKTADSEFNIDNALLGWLHKTRQSIPNSSTTRLQPDRVSTSHDSIKVSLPTQGSKVMSSPECGPSHAHDGPGPPIIRAGNVKKSSTKSTLRSASKSTVKSSSTSRSRSRTKKKKSREGRKSEKSEADTKRRKREKEKKKEAKEKKSEEKDRTIQVVEEESPAHSESPGNNKI